jgi:hypothetical protein
MWTCPNCAEENDDDAPSCTVCATRAQPMAAGAAPAGTSVPRPRETTSPAGRAQPAASASLEHTAAIHRQPTDPWAAQAPPAPSHAPSAAAPPGSPVGQFRPAPAYASVVAADPAPSKPYTTRLILPVVLALVVALGAAAIAAPRLLRSDKDENQAADNTYVSAEPATASPVEPTADSTTDAPESTDTVTDEPTTASGAVGLVTIDPGLTDDRAGDIAAMFDVYFRGINNKDYDSVGSVLDPAGSIDPADPTQMADLAKGTRSTQDSTITLISLSDVADGLLAAQVTFRSTQKPGDGPRGRTGETCTQWDIVYTISATSIPSYKIRRSRATSGPC